MVLLPYLCAEIDGKTSIIWTYLVSGLVMKKVVLIFPSTSNMADFILLYRIKGVLVSSSERSLSATLSEREIVIACTQFGAELKKIQIEQTL